MAAIWSVARSSARPSSRTERAAFQSKSLQNTSAVMACSATSAARSRSMSRVVDAKASSVSNHLPSETAAAASRPDAAVSAQAIAVAHRSASGTSALEATSLGIREAMKAACSSSSIACSAAVTSCSVVVLPPNRVNSLRASIAIRLAFSPMLFLPDESRENDSGLAKMLDDACFHGEAFRMKCFLVGMRDVRIDPDQSPTATIPPRQLCAWAGARGSLQQVTWIKPILCALDRSNVRMASGVGCKITLQLFFSK
jgi:hypothetical protein